MSRASRPRSGEVFDVLEGALKPLGFTVHRWVMGEPPDGPTENMVAIRGEGRRISALRATSTSFRRARAGRSIPFAAAIEDGVLVGRGASDMKSAIAAFVAAVSRVEPAHGTISFLITGDEEGYATYGTPRIIDWLNERQIRPDMILIGEPTSVDRLGDTVKIGRRGSVNMWIEVPGVQGHVAYPHRAKNPVPPLARVIAALDALHLDDGNEPVPAFEPRVHRDFDADRRQQCHPGQRHRAAQHPLQQPPPRHRPREAGRGDRGARGAGRKGAGTHFGRGFPDPARPALRRDRRGDRGRDGHRDRPFHQRRHIGRALPDPAVPGRRLRPSQWDDAQGWRMRGCGGYRSAVEYLRAGSCARCWPKRRTFSRPRGCSRSRRGSHSRTSPARR